MITSLIEILKLTIFDYMTTSAIKFDLRDKNFVGVLMDRSFDVITFISKYLYFEKG